MPEGGVFCGFCQQPALEVRLWCRRHGEYVVMLTAHRECVRQAEMLAKLEEA